MEQFIEQAIEQKEARYYQPHQREAMLSLV